MHFIELKRIQKLLRKMYRMFRTFPRFLAFQVQENFGKNFLLFCNIVFFMLGYIKINTCKYTKECNINDYISNVMNCDWVYKLNTEDREVPGSSPTQD